MIFRAFGRVDRGRAVDVTIDSKGHAFVVAVSTPLREVPKSVIDAIERKSLTEKSLVKFRPTEARIRHLVDIDKNQYEFFGDDPEGEPLAVQVSDDGLVLAMRDDDEVLREEAGIASPEPRPKGAVAAKGFAVLAARYGTHDHWVDITGAVQAAVEAGRDQFGTENLPDPASGHRKAMVMLYAMDGKVGLSDSPDGEPLPLSPRQDPKTLAEVPSQGFAVLAARFGTEDKWDDVTGLVRSRIARNRLDFRPAGEGMPDPAPGSVKALAVAYAIGGKVGLEIARDSRRMCLPLEAPPVNSETLLIRSVEFNQPLTHVAFAPDGKLVVVGVDDGSVRMIDATSGREAHRFDGHGPGHLTVAISATGGLVVSGGADKVVRVWDVKTEREKAVLRGHTDRIFRVAIAPNGRLAASTSWDKTVRLWDVTTAQEIRKFVGHTDIVDGLEFTPDGRQLVTASWDHTARAWDVASGREVRKYAGPEDYGDLSLSRNGKEVFLGSATGTLRIWTPSSGRDPVAVPTGAECGWAVAALPDGRRVLVSDSIAALLMDAKTGRPVLRLERHVGRIKGLSISPDGRRAASSSDDRTLKIWKFPDLPK